MTVTRTEKRFEKSTQIVLTRSCYRKDTPLGKFRQTRRAFAANSWHFDSEFRGRSMFLRSVSVLRRAFSTMTSLYNPEQACVLCTPSRPRQEICSQKITSEIAVAAGIEQKWEGSPCCDHHVRQFSSRKQPMKVTGKRERRLSSEETVATKMAYSL